jgi:hypothetical protein
MPATFWFFWAMAAIIFCVGSVRDLTTALLAAALTILPIAGLIHAHRRGRETRDKPP